MDKKGFTLIELLVVVGILSLIITGITISMQQQQRLFHLTGEAVDIDQTARTTLDYIATQVRNSVSRQGKFSISFVNGGSLPNNTNRCTNDTADSNTRRTLSAARPFGKRSRCGFLPRPMVPGCTSCCICQQARKSPCRHSWA